MEKTIQDHLVNALDDLTTDKLKKFKNKLVDRKQEPRVRRSDVEKVEYTTELVDLLIDTYTTRTAVQVALEVLRTIGCNQVAQNLEAATGGGCTALQAPVQNVPPPSAAGYDLPDTSAMLIPSSEQFKQDIISKKGQEIYPVLDKGVRKRLALLINNVEFDCKRKKRNGAQKDQENMEKLLRALGYDVVKHTDLSGREMDDAIKTFAGRSEHAESDSTFVVIMSHGQRDKISGIHHGPDNPDDFLPVDNIFNHLNTANCPALLNKPKVILIQACRGGKAGGTWVSDSHSDEEPDLEGDASYEHNEKDFISLLSCTPETKAYRDPVNGALFIGFLVQVFNAKAHEDHVEELFRQIMRHFEQFGCGQVKQMVCKDRGSMPKLFYLFPGL
ncbi:caspase a isoform X1 [Astyanax mexicanus]|uniref:caspase a isoform X1 n=1 Tax=Astyanax mexicanus TaxID=7994 RepID=UPI0020CAEA7E|nr:caspase a isoform X1 [Astyanax mexicanus]